jgi:hypothetical protein
VFAYEAFQLADERREHESKLRQLSLFLAPTGD